MPPKPHPETVFATIRTDPIRTYTKGEIHNHLTGTFIHQCLESSPTGPESAAALYRLFNERSTYLDQLLKFYRRVFLTLLALGEPGAIFALIDHGQMDSAMPLSRWTLSSVVPRIYDPVYLTQFRFMVMPLAAGEHRVFKELAEPPFTWAKRQGGVTVAVSRFDGSSNILRSVVLGKKPSEDLRLVKKLREPLHMLPVLASFEHGGELHLVYEMAPPKRYITLWTFLTQTIDAGVLRGLSTVRQQYQVIDWMNCLVGMVRYLQTNNISPDLVPEIHPCNIFVQVGSEVKLGFGNPNSMNFRPTVHSQPGVGEYAPGPQQRSGGQLQIFSLGCVFADLLVKLYERNMAHFRQRRGKQGPNCVVTYHFHHSLDATRDYLMEIDDEGLREIVLAMIVPSKRPGPQTVMGMLDGLRRQLFSDQKLFCCPLASPRGPQTTTNRQVSGTRK
ncbi:hypothetical protein EDC01DRAFT_446910 [Geopyxis carbonaria]|nr:hypothetical protein EDC01DRAFT_446910 [Geopyxis carbonaria]